jgi:hypothetical protein
MPSIRHTPVGKRLDMKFAQLESEGYMAGFKAEGHKDGETEPTAETGRSGEGGAGDSPDISGVSGEASEDGDGDVEGNGGSTAPTSPGRVGENEVKRLAGQRVSGGRDLWVDKDEEVASLLC